MGIFDAAALDRYVNRELNAIPAGKSTALIAWMTTNGEWHTEYIRRINGQWAFGAVLEGDIREKTIQGGVIVKGTW